MRQQTVSEFWRGERSKCVAKKSQAALNRFNPTEDIYIIYIICVYTYTMRTDYIREVTAVTGGATRNRLQNRSRPVHPANTTAQPFPVLASLTHVTRNSGLRGSFRPAVASFIVKPTPFRVSVL